MAVGVRERASAVARFFPGIWAMLYCNLIERMQKRFTRTGRASRLLDPNIRTSGLWFVCVSGM